MRSLMILFLLAMCSDENLVAYKVAAVRPGTQTTGIACDMGTAVAVDPPFSTPILKWSQLNLQYIINTSGLTDLPTSTTSTLISNAFSQWVSATSGRLNVTSHLSSDNFNPPKCGNPQGTITLMWSTDSNDLPADANAVTWLSYDRASGEIESAVIVFNQGTVANIYRDITLSHDQEVWTDNVNQAHACPLIPYTGPCNNYVDLQGVATHEIGHALGLKHNDTVYSISTNSYAAVGSPPYAVMNTGGNNRVLQPDDLQGICFLYSNQEPVLTFGTVSVNVTFNGRSWVGSISYYVVCPFRVIIGQAAPGSTSNVPTGTCVLSYKYGGPATLLPPVVSPSASQILATNGVVTFTLAFRSISTPPVAGFTMNANGLTGTDGPVPLRVVAQSDNMVTALFNAGTQNQDQGGTVSNWIWTIDGSPVIFPRGPQPSFAQSIGLGSHMISLVVADNWGMQSSSVQGTIVVSAGSAFAESFNNAPDFSNNWVIAGQAGSSTVTYTTGNFRIQAPPVCTNGNGGSGITYRSKQAFGGDVDASFQLYHGGYGRTSVGLWSVNTNQGVIQSILDTDDTAYLNFVSGFNATNWTYSSGPYMNKWITLRVQVAGSVVNFYADSGSGSQLLQTWPIPVASSPDSYYLAFGAGSVCWKSGANDTSFRLITATGQ